MNPLSLSPRIREPGILHGGQVMGDSGLSHPEFLHDLADAHLAILRKHLDDPYTNRITERLEHFVDISQNSTSINISVYVDVFMLLVTIEYVKGNSEGIYTRFMSIFVIWILTALVIEYRQLASDISCIVQAAGMGT